MPHEPSNSIPSLPPELLIRILTHHTDLVHLWSTCRLVSRSFRTYVEDSFAHHHLRHARIDFQLEKINLGGKSKRPEVPTTFCRLDTDRRYAVFGDARDKSEVKGPEGFVKSKARSKRRTKVKSKGKSKVDAESEFEIVMRRWEEVVKGSKPELPGYIICMGGCLNDTELPSLSIDVARREIKFAWRGMLEAFFRDEIAMLKQLDEEQTAYTDSLTSISSDSPPSQPQQPPIPPDLKVIRKQTRRKRLSSHYSTNPSMTWALSCLPTLDTSPISKLSPENLPDAGLGEPFFRVAYLPPSLLLDEWSCLQRIEVKAEQLGLSYIGGKKVGEEQPNAASVALKMARRNYLAFKVEKLRLMATEDERSEERFLSELVHR